MDTKQCNACAKVKPLKDFTKDSATPNGYKNKCKQCKRNKVPVDPQLSFSNRVRRGKYTTRMGPRDQWTALDYRLWKYKVTRDQFDTMWEEQDGKCAICSKCFSELFCFDHCHSTGAVRGLLCSGCNTGLGLLGDTVESLERALAYLKQS